MAERNMYVIDGKKKMHSRGSLSVLWCKKHEEVRGSRTNMWKLDAELRIRKASSLRTVKNVKIEIRE